jgi:hypothetical protein
LDIKSIAKKHDLDENFLAKMMSISLFRPKDVKAGRNAEWHARRYLKENSDYDEYQTSLAIARVLGVINNITPLERESLRVQFAERPVGQKLYQRLLGLRETKGTRDLVAWVSSGGAAGAAPQH